MRYSEKESTDIHHGWAIVDAAFQHIAIRHKDNLEAMDDDSETHMKHIITLMKTELKQTK